MTAPGSGTQRIGAYPVEREVGRGGMGVVYLGRDPRLDRPVAIKVLPDAFAADPERLARFEREARLLASLSHPNIAAIHGLEESEGRRFLVLEYVEGETLAQRIARGPLSVDDAVEVCRQIAAALEAAHESGIVHRDLKPGNVKLTPVGDVKVLDFGLAKAGALSGASSDPSLSASPTMSYMATSAGVILGTAAYMSPEQARGRSVDRRTDIWSFGCVLYECLTGRQVFAGETVSDMIALILQGEPDWKALPASTPPRLRELLERCLTKDPKKRLRDIGEARLLLEGGEISSASGTFAAAPPARPSRFIAALAAVFALTTLILAGLLLMRKPESAPLRRVTLEVPPMPYPARDAAMAALSPDGNRIASTADDSTGTPHLWVRELDQIRGRAVPGTDDGVLPAWSPDGHSLVFTTQDRVKKIDLRGGAPEVLCPVASYGRGTSWGSRGTIVFSGGPEGPIYRIAAEGGTATPATTLVPGETGHRFPRFLPDGRHFLYVSMPSRAGLHDVWLGSTDDARRRVKLLEAEGVPVYVKPGWLVFTRNGRVVAQRFDARSRRLAGRPVALPDEPRRTTWLGAPWLAAGERGPFAYYRSGSSTTQLVWMTFPGSERQPLPLAPGPYSSVALSPDGSRAILDRPVSQAQSDFWLLDLDRMTQTRFTSSGGRVDRPLWSPDGSRVAYSTDRAGRWDVFVKEIGAAGPGRPVLESGALLKYSCGWTPDGGSLLVEQIGEKTGWDIWEVPLAGGGKPRPVFATSFDEQGATVSQDGRWVALASNEPGRAEVFVDSWPTPGRRSQVSTAGGVNPRWSSDGREIVYVLGQDAWRVSIDPATGRAQGAPRLLRGGEEIVSASFSPDFRRLLALVTVESDAISHAMILVDHWRSALKSR